MKSQVRSRIGYRAALIKLFTSEAILGRSTATSSPSSTRFAPLAWTSLACSRSGWRKLRHLRVRPRGIEGLHVRWLFLGPVLESVCHSFVDGLRPRRIPPGAVARPAE